MTNKLEPSTLALGELRARRAALQEQEDAVSYVRRVVQARLDLVRAESARRGAKDPTPITQELPVILSQHLTGGPARPPRPTVDLSDHPLAVELDELCASLGEGRLLELSDEELGALSRELEAFERRRSAQRKDLFAQIDELSDELVRRYRDGEADVDGLLADD